MATPQLGNTQDVALRAYLKTQGYTTDLQGGGDVSIKPQSNSQTVTAFKAGSIDGAWVPEPYVSELVAAGGHRAGRREAACGPAASGSRPTCWSAPPSSRPTRPR